MDRVLEAEVMDDIGEAEAYESMDHAAANTSFVERLIALGAHGKMLDLGCGPGHIPLMVVAQLPDVEVVAIDLAESMLELARKRVQGSGFSPRVTFRRVDAKALPFADASFDVVFSNTILHHIPQPEAMLTEARRVLRKGGVLLIRDLFRPATLAEVERLVELHAPGCTRRQRDLFRDSLRAALHPGELKVLAEQCGLGDAELRIDSDRHMSLQRCRG